MSLNKAILEQAIIAAMDQAQTEEKDANKAKQKYAKDLATAIDAFVKTGTVNVTVNTTGSAAAQTGTGIGTIT